MSSICLELDQPPPHTTSYSEDLPNCNCVGIALLRQMVVLSLCHPSLLSLATADGEVAPGGPLAPVAVGRVEPIVDGLVVPQPKGVLALEHSGHRLP